METGTTTVYDGALLAAVQSGQASLALVDDAVLRILTTMFRIGVFDTDYTADLHPGRGARRGRPGGRGQGDHAAEEHRRAAADRLPTKSIAVIGADANILAAESGSAYVVPDHRHADPAGHHRPGRVGAPASRSRRATIR